MGRWKAFIPIILALVIAIGGSIFMYRWLQNKTSEPQIVKVEGDRVSIVVAAADLPQGTKLNKEMLKEIPFLKESLPTGFQSDPKSVLGRVLMIPIKEKEPVLDYKLASTDITVGGVSAVIEPGKRAVAVKGDKVLGISGFVKPGNRVDVLVTIGDTTKLVLGNMLVMATGTMIEENKEGKTNPVDVYTLEVDPEQAEKLALAQAKGRLQFALRNSTDSKEVLTKGATVKSTLASLREDEEKPPVDSTKKWTPRYTTIEVIKGDKVSKQKLRL